MQVVLHTLHSIATYVVCPDTATHHNAALVHDVIDEVACLTAFFFVSFLNVLLHPVKPFHLFIERAIIFGVLQGFMSVWGWLDHLDLEKAAIVEFRHFFFTVAAFTLLLFFYAGVSGPLINLVFRLEAWLWNFAISFFFRVLFIEFLTNLTQLIFDLLLLVPVFL